MNVKLKIDNQEVEAEKGTPIIEAAKQLGIEIPALCHHPAMEHYGSCRLCLVDVTRKGRTKLSTACTHPVAEGLEVTTNTEKIKNYRKLNLELMLSRAPNSKILQDMAKEMGLDKVRFKNKETDCILCGKCVRVCKERMGSAAITFSGRGVEREVTYPFSEPSVDCLGCGACAFVCPTDKMKPEEICSRPIEKLPSDFNCGLETRPVVYSPFPQAVPNAPVIDRENCVHYNNDTCGICEKVCAAGAIDYEQEDEIIEEEVGALVVATGYDLMDPSVYEEYGYKKYPDVVTSLEFERMVSSSGPTGGKIKRPSDGNEPKNIVFIQCVGSRDESMGYPYCSGICCMYTAKHTMLFKHKIPDGKAFVFYMDVRASGKNYEQFIRRVVTEKKAIYLRGRVSKIFPRGPKLIVRGADTLSGGQVEIKADMVVLATAITASKDADKLARTLKVSYDEYNFLSEAHPKLRPIETNTAGIFLAGTCQAPRDIPETVAQASGAAAKVLGIIHSDELERDPAVAVISEDSCNACFDCQKVCAYNAVEEKEIRDRKGELIKIVARVNEGMCQGCGACAASCRSGCIDVQGFTDDQIHAEILAS